MEVVIWCRFWAAKLPLIGPYPVNPYYVPWSRVAGLLPLFLPFVVVVTYYGCSWSFFLFVFRYCVLCLDCEVCLLSFLTEQSQCSPVRGCSQLHRLHKEQHWVQEVQPQSVRVLKGFLFVASPSYTIPLKVQYWQSSLVSSFQPFVSIISVSWLVCIAVQDRLLEETSFALVVNLVIVVSVICEIVTLTPELQAALVIDMTIYMVSWELNVWYSLCSQA